MAWLLMQVVSGSVFVQRADAALPAEALATAGILSSDTMVICTPRGLVVISLDADGKEIPQDSNFFPGCEWCQPFGGPAAIAGPEQSGLKLPNTRLYRATPLSSQVAAQKGDADAFRSRAPPL